MFGDLAIGDAEYVNSDHRLGSPSEIAAVNGDKVAFRHHKAWFVLEVSPKVSEQRLDRGGAVWNLWIVLPVVVAEQPVQNCGISLDKNPLDSRKNQFRSLPYV